MNKYFTKPQTRLLLLLIWFALVVTATSASVMTVGDGEVTAIGGTADISLILDNAPDGLSGYNITIAVDDPQVATITGVSLPEWVPLSDTSAIPASSCHVKVVDLGEQVQAGATSVKLTNVTIKGLSTGTSPVTVTLNKINDDHGEKIYPTVLSGTIVVNGTGPNKVPEFPSDILPAFLIVGFLGAVLFIQRTRDP